MPSHAAAGIQDELVLEEGRRQRGDLVEKLRLVLGMHLPKVLPLPAEGWISSGPSRARSAGRPLTLG
jgi:hypothetical protein